LKELVEYKLIFARCLQFTVLEKQQTFLEIPRLADASVLELSTKNDKRGFSNAVLKT